MGHLKRAIEQETNGTYVVSIRIGNNIVEVRATYAMYIKIYLSCILLVKSLCFY